MLLCWVLLLGSVGNALCHPLKDPVSEADHDVIDLLAPRARREIISKPSNIFWVQPVHPSGKSKYVGKDFLIGDKDLFLRKVYRMKPKRRVRRAFPSTDAVSDTDVTQWQRKTAPKTEFVTAREHKSTLDVDARHPDPKINEVDPSFRSRASSEILTSRDYRIEDRDNARPWQPQRRIIYYANLPEITSRDRSSAYAPYQSRYDPGTARAKYPRESSFEDTRARSYPLPSDRYRYHPSGQTPSYTIVDAEAPRNNYYPRSTSYQGLPNTKFNKIPAPYRQGDYPARSREPLGSQVATLVRNEPYRDYNPRQPAPWSVQIGTKLTVKDDGRPFRPDVGQRRFYVNSQEPPSYNRVDRSRYNYHPS